MNGRGVHCWFTRGATVAALALLLWAAWGAPRPLLAQSPTPSPVAPGTGGVTFGVVRVLSGNALPRNAGQESQPPVWIKIDGTGSSAVVTIGNATRVPLDFSGTIVIALAPGVQASGALVSTGTAVVQGTQVVWNGFSLSSGQIVPAIVLLQNSGTAAPSGTSAIEMVAIEAKSPQGGEAVSEDAGGGGPLLSALAAATAGAIAANAGRAPVNAQPGGAAAPFSNAAARTLGGWLLALLVCLLAVLLVTAGLVVRTSRRLERRLGELAASAAQHERLSAAAVSLVETAHALRESAGAPSRDGRPLAASQAPATAGQPPLLEAVSGAEPGRRWPLQQAAVTIGRNPRNDIVVSDPMVSDRHARLVQQAAGTYLLVDEASTNGTLLNGALLAKPVVLRDGDRVGVGGTLLLFYEALPQAASNAYTPG